MVIYKSPISKTKVIHHRWLLETASHHHFTTMKISPDFFSSHKNLGSLGSVVGRWAATGVATLALRRRYATIPPALQHPWTRHPNTSPLHRLR